MSTTIIEEFKLFTFSNLLPECPADGGLFPDTAAVILMAKSYASNVSPTTPRWYPGFIGSRAKFQRCALPSIIEAFKGSCIKTVPAMSVAAFQKRVEADLQAEHAMTVLDMRRYMGPCFWRPDQDCAQLGGSLGYGGKRARNGAAHGVVWVLETEEDLQRLVLQCVDLQRKAEYPDSTDDFCPLFKYSLQCFEFGEAA